MSNKLEKTIPLMPLLIVEVTEIVHEISAI